MFNLKKAKNVQPQEKYLRDENIGPDADDNQPIVEKTLDHAEEGWNTPAEDHLEDKRQGEDTVIIEKTLNEAKGYLGRHAEDGVSVPPINAAVAQEERKRAKAFKTEKDSHWSQTFNEKKQQGSLPKLKKNAPQHDKIVLNNDPRRFEGKSVKPLVGGITTADVDRVVARIKHGDAAEYDIAIAAILKEADSESRELTPVERQTVTDLKIARTQAMMKTG